MFDINKPQHYGGSGGGSPEPKAGIAATYYKNAMITKTLMYAILFILNYTTT